MRALDRAAIEEYRIPGIVLMENAAMSVVRSMEARYGILRGRSVLILCGKGNNGGDGMAVARHLANRGVRVTVRLLGSAEDVRGDAAVNLAICERMKIPFRFITRPGYLPSLASLIGKVDLIVDALLGTGVVPPVRGMVKQVVRRINRSGKPVVSVDLPTGLSADTSELSGEVVQADLTVTFGLPKISLVQYPSRSAAGEVEVADISLPSGLVEKADIPVELLEGDLLRSLPSRSPDFHKGQAGRALIVAGSAGMPGAAVMTTLAALRVGAGLVYGAVPNRIRGIFHRRIMEGIVVPLPESERDCLTPESLPMILDASEGKDAAAVGPGIGFDRKTGKMIRSLLQDLRIPVVLDADGINLVAEDPSILKKSPAPLILTPHPGEMGRLTGTSREILRTRKVDLAREFAVTFRVILVLKGAGTVVADPTGRVWINTSGNPGMATAGTGDVLTGMITGLLAQGLEPVEAAKVGVYLHGLCGDRAAGRCGERSLLARDLIREIPSLLRSSGETTFRN